MSETNISKWINLPSETQNIEFKEARNQLDTEKLYQYCCAIANEGGGKLVLGMTDKPPREVVGTNAFREPLKIETKILQVLNFRVNTKEEVYNDKRVLVFSIPPRPTGMPYNYKGSYYMRSGSSLVAMTPDHLKAIFNEDGLEWIEQMSKERLSPQEVTDLLDVQTFFELLKQPFPTDQNGVIDRLLQERLVTNTDMGLTITKLCALLLAKRISDFPDIERKAVRVIVYDGKTKTKTRLDTTGNKGYACGFNGLVEHINSQLPQNEVINEAIRSETKLVSPDIVRELMANSLIHQDFNQQGTSVTVEIYDNRVIFSNPGTPIVPIDRFIDSEHSRNERLAHVMRKFGICEEKGSGLDRVIEEVEISQLPAPEFHESHNKTRVTIFGQKPFRDMSKDERIRACYQHCALKWVLSEPMTNNSLRERFHLSQRQSTTVSQIITNTVNTGKIKADEQVGGSRKFARYAPEWA